jgi:hypothetical protein
MPLLSKRSSLAAKIETTPGTAITLAAADMIDATVRNVSVSPSIEKIQRDSQNTFAKIPSASGERRATVSFDTDLLGDGAGTSPGWCDQLWPACGLVNLSGEVWTATSGEAVGTNVKTLTIEACINGIRHTIAGAVGTFQLSGGAGKPVACSWTFEGKYLGKSDAAVLADTVDTTAPLKWSSSGAFDLDGYTPCVSTFSYDFGNQLFLRPCQGTTDETGFVAGEITDRVTTFQIDPEAATEATEGLFGDWEGSTSRPVQFVFSNSDDKLTVYQNAEIVAVSPGDRGGLHIEQYTLQVIGVPTFTWASA